MRDTPFKIMMSSIVSIIYHFNILPTAARHEVKIKRINSIRKKQIIICRWCNFSTRKQEELAKIIEIRKWICENIETIYREATAFLQPIGKVTDILLTRVSEYTYSLPPSQVHCPNQVSPLSFFPILTLPWGQSHTFHLFMLISIAENKFFLENLC